MIRDWYLDELQEVHPAGGSRRHPVVLGLALSGILGIGYMLGHQAVPDAPARIGGSDVPVGLHCQEDEAIALVGPGAPVCVNVGQLGAPVDGTVKVDGVVYGVNDSERPGCFMEPSDTSEGVEVIRYPHLSMKTTEQGIEVAC